MTEEERREAKLPAEYRMGEVLAHRGRPEYPELVSAREQALRQLALREEREREEYSKGWGRVLGRPVHHRRYRRGG